MVKEKTQQKKVAVKDLHQTSQGQKNNRFKRIWRPPGALNTFGELRD